MAGCSHSPYRDFRMSHTLSLPEFRISGFSTMLVVRNLVASENFYRHHFGFEVTEGSPSMRRLERLGATIYLVVTSPPTIDKPGITLSPPPDRDKPSVNLVFRVKDVRSVYSALAARGLVFLSPPAQPAWGGWRAFTQDPDGYLIEIEEP